MSITTNIANGNFMLVQFLVERLYHFASALFIERGNSEANNLAIIVWINAQIGPLYSFFDICQQLAIPGLNYQQASLWNRDRGHLVDRSWSPIVINLDTLYKGGTGTASPNRGQVLSQNLNRLLHTSFSISKNIISHSKTPFL